MERARVVVAMVVALAYASLLASPRVLLPWPRLRPGGAAAGLSVAARPRRLASGRSRGGTRGRARDEAAGSVILWAHGRSATYTFAQTLRATARWDSRACLLFDIVAIGSPSMIFASAPRTPHTLFCCSDDVEPRPTVKS